LQGIARAAAERAESGMELSDSLEPAEDRFPPFFLPVIRCGEQGGRLDEALRYLERHCALLVAPARMMRNTWLFPLVIVLAGSALKIAAHVMLAPTMQTLAFVAQTATIYAAVGAVLFFIFGVPQAKFIVDNATLLLPVVGQAERELAVNRFLHSFNLLYSTGGTRVEGMIRLAAWAVQNLVIREDLLRAAEVIESGGTITEAFAAPAAIAEEHKAVIAAGDEGGKLEEAFATVSRLTAESVRHRLTMFNQIFYRVMLAAVVFSIIGTVFSLVMTARPGS